MGKVVKTLGRFGNKPNEWIFGKKLGRKFDPAGRALGIYKEPAAAAPEPEAPSPVTDDMGIIARNRMRRVAKKAQGAASTIRTGATGAPYTGAPSKLLGG